MKQWWKTAIGYQIYPATFFDGNKDGIGDLQGIIAKLDYLQNLGVSLLWVSPFYLSSHIDGGYDVIDHKRIDPIYGSMDDFECFLEEAHKRGMKVVVDLILNHTSISHRWFKEAMAGDLEKKDYYIIRKGKKVGNRTIEPNNWSSFFHESAWSPIADDEYYLHIFSKDMPDLNWENPKVKEAMYDIAKFWLEKGVDGFRLDALAHLAKDPYYLDSGKDINAQGYSEDWQKFSNQPHLFSYLYELKKQVFEPYNCISIGEVGGNISAKEALRFVNYHSGSINMMFNFECNGVHNGYGEDYEEVVCDVVRLKKIFETWIHTYGNLAWFPLYWTNHDQSRVLSQYGSIKYRKESAKMLASLLLFMGGTPFIYNGDEIGMSNYKFSSLDEFDDIKAQNYIKANKAFLSEEEMLDYLNQSSRMHARTAMQWDTTKNAGFSLEKTNVYVNENYQEVNVENQLKDENSILNFYKKAILLRQNKYLDTVLDGYLSFVDLYHEDVIAYVKTGKQKLLVIANFKEKEVVFTHKQRIASVVLQNYANVHLQMDKIFLRPYEVIVAEVL